MQTLSIIGGGKIGKTLGYLFVKNNCFQIQDVLCRSMKNAQAAVQFIGEGHPITNYSDLTSADVIMITVNDDQLSHAIQHLSATHCLSPATIAFHCSGSFNHDILLPLKKKLGLSLASIHPAKSFSSIDKAHLHSDGTYYSLEGDQEACDLLSEKITLIGGKLLPIQPENKMLYHIATIFSSNYFVTLLDTSLQLLEEIGIPRDTGLEILEPLALGAFQQVKKLGTARALTGPISRSDTKLIEQHLQLLKDTTEKFLPAYQALGKLTVALAKQTHVISEQLDEALK